MAEERTEIANNKSAEFIQVARSKTTAIICIVCIAIALIFSIIVRDSIPYVINLFVLAAIFGVGLLLSYNKKERLAEQIITISATLWIAEMSVVFGSRLGIENYLIIALVAITLYYSKGWYRILSIITIVALAAVIKIYQLYYPPIFALPEAIDFLYVVNVIAPFIIICIICWNVINDAIHYQSVIRKQNDALIESIQFKDKVFSIIGHDMRSPFNSAKSLIGLIENELLTQEEKRDALTELKEGIDVSLQTLDNILGWASQGYYGSIMNAKTKMESISLYNAVDRVARLFSHIANKKRIVFINNIAPDIFVNADLEQLSFVLRNLTSNALKFSFEGQNITFSAKIDENGKTMVSIRDEGIGMTQDMLASLFQVSTRFSKEGTGKEKGTGLGLIFCKEFIRNNNGDIWVESEPSRGTLVNFTLG